MFLESRQTELDAALDEMAARPGHDAPRPPPTKFNIWRTTTAAPRGVAAGAAESTGFWADAMHAFGQTMAATDARSGGMFSTETPAERQQNVAATDKLREGIDFNSETGDLFRNVAKGYRPDPATAHWAEQSVFGFTRLATKAVGYSALAGPTVGAMLTAADEGMTVADELRLQGVDLRTRTLVGAMQGGAAGLGVRIPMAGRTLAETVGLVAAGGPGLFIGQQAATQHILEQAGYHDIAMQYDPLDPAGLITSTLIPAGFGAFGLHGNRVRAAAKAEADFLAATLPSEPTAGARAVADAYRPTQDHVDAALVLRQLEQRQASSPAESTDLAGQAKHADALVKAEDQLAAGQPVNVDAPAVSAATAPRFVDFLTSLQAGAKDVATQAKAMGLTEGAPAAPRLNAEVPAIADGFGASTSRDPAASAPAPDVLAKQTRARLDEIKTTHPDLTVMLDGMSKPARLADFLEFVKAEAAKEVEDVPLYQQAAECFLLNGA